MYILVCEKKKCKMVGFVLNKNKSIRVSFSVAFLIACACIGMWGCSDDSTFKWENRSASRVVSLVDDSLALLYNCRSYSICREGVGPLGYTDCGGGCENYGLFLANYRKKQPIYWGDTSNLVVVFMRGFYRDSTVIFLKNDYNEFGFWKIGEQPKSAKKLKWNSPCSGYDGYNFTRFRPWINGNVLLIGAKGCDYAVLDTATGDVNELLMNGEYAWFNECADVTYLDGKEVCLGAVYEDGRYGVWTYENGIKTDSLIWENAKWSIVSEDNVKIIGGKLFLIEHPTQLLDGKSNPLNGWTVNIINPLNPITPMIRMDKIYSLFVDSMGLEIKYDVDDLYVVKGR